MPNAESLRGTNRAAKPPLPAPPLCSVLTNAKPPISICPAALACTLSAEPASGPAPRHFVEKRGPEAGAGRDGHPGFCLGPHAIQLVALFDFLRGSGLVGWVCTATLSLHQLSLGEGSHRGRFISCLHACHWHGYGLKLRENRFSWNSSCNLENTTNALASSRCPSLCPGMHPPAAIPPEHHRLTSLCLYPHLTSSSFFVSLFSLLFLSPLSNT